VCFAGADSLTFSSHGTQVSVQLNDAGNGEFSLLATIAAAACGGGAALSLIAPGAVAVNAGGSCIAGPLSASYATVDADCERDFNEFTQPNIYDGEHSGRAISSVGTSATAVSVSLWAGVGCSGTLANSPVPASALVDVTLSVPQGP
jgi:hypothetical protein